MTVVFIVTATNIPKIVQVERVVVWFGFAPP